jgi:hypothetical protein
MVTSRRISAFINRLIDMWRCPTAGAEHRLSAVKLRGSSGRSLDALTALQFSRFAKVPVARPSLQVFLAQGQTTELDHRAPVDRHQNPAKPSGLL